MASVFVVVFFSIGQFAFELLDPEAEILDDLRRFVPGLLRMSLVRDDVVVRVVDSTRYSCLVCDLPVFWGWVKRSRVILA